tara:strand:- start:615 stop:1049 length:435 start_codon:yes stop_codon:yes gene_type:complete
MVRKRIKTKTQLELMKTKKKLGIALVHQLCPVCTKEMDSSILMNTKLSEKEAESIERLDGTIKWSKDWCKVCEDMKTKGFILIGAVEAKTDDATNPYRSGNIWVVKQEVADALFAPHGAPKSGVAFVDVTIASQMQLPDVNLKA